MTTISSSPMADPDRIHDRGGEVGGERGDAALPRQMVAKERDGLERRSNGDDNTPAILRARTGRRDGGGGSGKGHWIG